MTMAFLTLLPQLLAAGIATAEQIKALLSARNKTMTDDELNAVLAMIVASAEKHRALAAADQLPNA